MAFDWPLKNNYDLPGRAKFSGKMKETGNFSWHNAYDNSGNNVTPFPNLNSKSKKFVDTLTTAGEKALLGSSKALVNDKRKQPNTEMREKLLTIMSETFPQSMTNKLKDNFDFNELPCSSKEGAKWTMIRMYQERNRRREARRRRQREKEREESRGKKSKKRRKSRSKSRKRRKGRKRSTSKKRRKSRSRKKSVRNRRKSRGRSRSKSRKKSRSGSRKRSAKSTGKKRRKSPR